MLYVLRTRYANAFRIWCFNLSQMEDKNYLIDNYQQEILRYQIKELNRNYQRLTVEAIKIGVVTGVISGLITGVIVFKFLLD